MDKSKSRTAEMSDVTLTEHASLIIMSARGVQRDSLES
jgi:hypothetical protein